MDNIIDGVKLSLSIKESIKKEIESKKINPCLAVIQIGDNKASNVYIRNKEKSCSNVGIEFKHIKFDSSISEEIVIKEIEKLNSDDNVNGILVQLPLPDGFDEGKIINKIDPVKDVDGLTYTNVGNLVLQNECLIPCTAHGVIEMLKMYNVLIEGKNVCLVGRSNLVGKPLMQLLLRENATLTVCHSKSIDIKKYTKMADILIVAVGHPKLITKDMVKDDAVVIDIGINKGEHSLCGDVDFDEVSKKVKLITPVPGGVGPMTVACLLKNVMKAYEIQHR